MTQTVSIWLGTEIIYVYGTVNGTAATFTLMGAGLWQAEVPRAPDDRYDLHIEAYSEYGLEETLDITLYYGLMPPKTDWTARDYENAEDFNRQKHNIEFIATGLLHELYYFPDHIDIDDQGMTDIPTIGLVNLIEDNLAKIESCGMTLPPGWEMSKVWVAGGVAPDYTDANRWECNPLLMYEMAALIPPRFRPAGTFAAGQQNLLPRRVI